MEGERTHARERFRGGTEKQRWREKDIIDGKNPDIARSSSKLKEHKEA